MLSWLKRYYSEVAETDWNNCENSNEAMLRPCSKYVKKQLKLEKQAKLEQTINELGFTEGIDFDGKYVLKNNVPFRKHISQTETREIIRKLNTTKSKTKNNGNEKDIDKQKNMDKDKDINNKTNELNKLNHHHSHHQSNKLLLKESSMIPTNKKIKSKFSSSSSVKNVEIQNNNKIVSLR